MIRRLSSALPILLLVSAGVALSQDGVSTSPERTEGETTNTSEHEQLTRRIAELLRPTAPDSTARLPRGSALTAAAYWAGANRYRSKEPDFAERMKALVRRIAGGAAQGEDVVGNMRGFFWRGYETPYNPDPQLYSIYVPQTYTPSKAWPLIVSLHGGSSNHNVWMAELLGHHLPTKEYRSAFRKSLDPRVHQNEVIIAAPQGLGQNHWMGEARRDVQDVINDVRAAYNIDENRIFLNGLSNGAVASYRIGLTDAWRFAGVLPMSGLTDWVSHAAGGRAHPAEMLVLKNESALTIAENAANTHFSFIHGSKDPGFDVSQARSFASRLKNLGIPFEYREIPNVGHNTTRIQWRDLRILRGIRDLRRKERVQEIRLVATSERSARQHWVILDDRKNHLQPGRIRASITTDTAVEVETDNVARFTLLLADAPVRGQPKITVNDTPIELGPYAAVDRITLNAAAGEDGRIHWIPWDGRTWDRKRARLSGPLPDLAWEPQVHVYGTQVPEDTDTLKRAAVLGARGWTRDPEFTQVRHPVIPDTALTPELVRERALVLYGNAKNNAVLREIGHRLPIRIGEDYLELRGKRLERPDFGAKFICPNPLRPDRYVVVLAGVSAEAVARGGTLPIFLPDYIVFDRRFRDPVQRMVLGRRDAVELGFFTETWELPPPHQSDSEDLSGVTQ